MKPLILQGHERPITQVKYNREGDLLFTIAKEKEPNIYYTVNGERLGTFEGHKGAIWCIDVDYDTEKVITGAADDSLNIWNPENGQLINSIKTQTSVRSCNFSYDGNVILLTTDNIKNYQCEIFLYDIRDNVELKPIHRIKCPRPVKVTKSLWGPVDTNFITGHEDGNICRFDMRAQKFDYDENHHNLSITDMQPDRDNCMFITSSKDCTAKLFNMYTLERIKTYTSDRPLNSASISPIREHVILGGGQEAASVTTTAASEGKFEAMVYHQVFESSFCSIKGHYGPINSLAFHPKGIGFVSGGEEGLVRLNEFDKDYFEFKLKY